MNIRVTVQSFVKILTAFVVVMFAVSCQAIEAQTNSLAIDFFEVTNIAQLRQLVCDNVGSICHYSLVGTVLAVDPSTGSIYFQDDTGTEILEINQQKQPIEPGMRIRVQGTNYVAATATGISLGREPVVNNDGRHTKAECTATVALKAGRYPIQLSWFNFTRESFLELDYSGPGMARQKIPDAVLYRLVPTQSPTVFTHGLDYNYYEGQWQQLPSFQDMAPLKTGVISNFDLKEHARSEYVGLLFNGFLQIDRDGLYTFYLTSDDGSRLFLHNQPTELTVLGMRNLPSPTPIVVRQPLSENQGPFWAEVEGVVDFLGNNSDGTELELSSVGAHMRVEVHGNQPGASGPPRYLLGSRVRMRGMCLETKSTEKYRVADTLAVPNWDEVKVMELATERWTSRHVIDVDDLPSNPPDASEVVLLRGQIRSLIGKSWELSGPTNSLRVKLLNADPPPRGTTIECLGEWTPHSSGPELAKGVWRALPPLHPDETNGLPILTTAAQVQQLNRDQTKLGYWARIQGVVTWVSEYRDCVVLQDQSGRGVFVGLRREWQWDSPKVGEILKIEGHTVASDFSPIVILDQGEKLGMGVLPVPKAPTWDQLINGSLDSQYVEVRGLVTDAHENHLTLLMPGGKIDVEFDPSPMDSLGSLVDSVVRIRGCLFAKWDPHTLLVVPEHPLWFGNATICVDTPAPADPFAVHRMKARELMQFDAQANIFQRVKISGQVLGESGGIYYLNDGDFGVRFQPAQPIDLKPGDEIDVAGLVELGGPSPMLREALARKIGQAALPSPQALTFDSTNVIRDATRVWVEGHLVDSKISGTDRILEMETGLRHYLVRLPEAKTMPEWAIGSRLKITGVYVDQGSSQQNAGGAKAFELLLNSPGDVRLIARPPWWTLNRLLTMIAILAAGLLLAFVWINQLRRQVERRSRQLKHEISERQRAEQDRAIEQERSRIARDLHDDLGSSLTAINMLATTTRSQFNAEASSERLQLIMDRSRSMVTALDALVWVINPQNDSIGALAEYLASFTEELLAKTDVAYHIELPANFPQKIIAAETRHNILLAVKEALSNAIRHGRPTEIWLQLAFLNDELVVAIKDNGRGFDLAQCQRGEGLANLQERMKKINGRCQIDTHPGKGTIVSLTLPL